MKYEHSGGVSHALLTELNVREVTPELTLGFSSLHPVQYKESSQTLLNLTLFLCYPTRFRGFEFASATPDKVHKLSLPSDTKTMNV